MSVRTYAPTSPMTMTTTSSTAPTTAPTTSGPSTPHVEVRIWRSFACNNSTSFRLVARFDDERTATVAREDLVAFFVEAGPLTRPPRARAGGRRQPERANERSALPAETAFPHTAAMDRLATEHGFDWTGLLVSGVYDDEVEVVNEGPVLVVFHPYCLGLGDDLPRYLTARGARVIERSTSDLPSVSVLVRLTDSANAEAADAMKKELAAIFAQAENTTYIREWPIRLPWAREDVHAATAFATSERTAFFCDDKLLGFYLPMDPACFRGLKEYLRKAGIDSPSIRLCEAADLPKFRAIARARCSHCQSRLSYLEMHEHGLKADQLACEACGGMFELAMFDVLEPDRDR